jgi:hypothetical protein
MILVRLPIRVPRTARKNADDEIPHRTCGAHPSASGRASAARADSSTASIVNISAAISRGTGPAPVAIAR